MPTDTMLTRELSIKFADLDTRSIDVIASTNAVDSYGEIVEQNWNLERYNTNPLVLYGHNRFDLPIGHATDVGVDESGKLVAKLHFVTKEANPLAEQVWQSIKQKSLRAVSVGFTSGEPRIDRVNGHDVLVLNDNELREISVVPMPANPEALIQMRAKADAARQSHAEHVSVESTKEEPNMKLIAIELGLDEGASESDIRKSIKALRARAEQVDTFTKLAEKADVSEAVGALQGFKAAAVQVKALETEIERMKSESESKERAELVATGTREGKLTPAMVEKFVPDMTVKQLRAFLEVAPKAIPFGHVNEPGANVDAKNARDEWSKMAPKEKADLFQSDRARYDALKSAASGR